MQQIIIDALHRTLPAYANKTHSPTSPFSLNWVPTQLDDQTTNTTLLTLQLIQWDTQTHSIMNIIEQQCFFCSNEHLQMPQRLVNFIEAWTEVLSQILDNPSLNTAMPHELLPHDALNLVRAKTTEDFIRALSAKSRLGKWLPKK